MRKTILLAMAALAAAAYLTGCNSGTELSNADYIIINGNTNNAEQFRTDPDAALEAVRSDQTAEPGEKITLNNGIFSIKENLSANYSVTWDGSYTLENQTLKLQYDSMSGGGTDKPDTAGSRIPALNETGAYPARILPQCYLSEAARTAGFRLPFYLLRADASPSVLEVHGDFLCVPVYGFTIDGSYRKGGDFTVDYVPENTLRDDRWSLAYYNETDKTFSAQPDEERISAQLSMLAGRYGIPDGSKLQLRLTFSGGSWEMTASDGTSISKGGYQESEKHPGLIAMYAESDEPQKQKIISEIRPLFLYIEKDNSVYYPGFIRLY